MTAVLYDKNRRPIQDGDVLKVFHFIGARRKRHYMYKIAGVYMNKGKLSPTPYLVINHLPQCEGMYYEPADGRVLKDYEIVQGYGPGEERYSFEKRPRKAVENEN